MGIAGGLFLAQQSTAKNCGPKYANAVDPVDCCARNSPPAIPILFKFPASTTFVDGDFWRDQGRCLFGFCGVFVGSFWETAFVGDIRATVAIPEEVTVPSPG
jgi:hypothetical protein